MWVVRLLDGQDPPVFAQSTLTDVDEGSFLQLGDHPNHITESVILVVARQREYPPGVMAIRLL